MKKSIYIYGASGHGLVVADIAMASGYKNIIFIDDGDNIHQIFDPQNLDRDIPFALGIGDNQVRSRVFDKIEANGFKVITLIHPSAIISPSTTIDRGSVIMPLVVVNAKTHIAKGVILNSSCIIEHENIIEDFVHISPNVALGGDIVVGRYTHIGIGTNIIQGIRVGQNNIIGGGSMLISSTKDNQKLVGVPAKVIESR